MTERLNKAPSKKLKGIGGIVASLTLAACNTSPTPTPTSSGEVLGASTGPNLNLDFPFNNTWYYTGGPHSDGLSKGVRYAVDFSPANPISCPGGITPLNEIVTASESGKVIVAGDSPQGVNNSVVEIQNNNGFIVGYMHLDNIDVAIGQNVNVGDPLGNPSCEIPSGGHTSGVHVHEYLQDRNGNALPIAGTIFSGFQVQELPTNYNGLLINGVDIRTADVGRFGPGARADGLRNDVTNGTDNIPQESLNPEAILDKYLPIEASQDIDHQLVTNALRFFVETYTSKQNPVPLKRDSGDTSLQIVSTNLDQWISNMPALLASSNGEWSEPIDDIFDMHYKFSGRLQLEAEAQAKNFQIRFRSWTNFSAEDSANGFERIEEINFRYLYRGKNYDPTTSTWSDFSEWSNGGGADHQDSFEFVIKNGQVEMLTSGGISYNYIEPTQSTTDPMQQIPWLAYQHKW